MRIFLNPEVFSGLGEDTFWSWMVREFQAEVGIPKRIGIDDICIHYSTMGKPKHPRNTITLLWELYPEMSLRLNRKYFRKNILINSSQKSRWATCPTHYSRAFYDRDTFVLPIPVDTELFSPPADKKQAKNQLGIDSDQKVAFWSGQSHHMKGADLIESWQKANPDWKLLQVRKEEPISQLELAKMMQASDGILNTSRLVPLYMTEWEALACDIPFIEAGGIQREYNPTRPRKFIFEMGWSREQGKETWIEAITRCSFICKNER